jgi:hypothetical protein
MFALTFFLLTEYTYCSAILLIVHASQQSTSYNELSHTPSVSESNLFAPVPLQSPLAVAAAPASGGRNDIVVSVKNVHKTYLLGVEGVPALRGVSLDIKRCRFLY